MFGEPGDATWGWQLSGHHVSLNFTIAEGRGSHPPRACSAPSPPSYGLLAPLADDEELGFRFVNSLEGAQRQAAIIHHRPPPDLAARMVPRIGEVERPDPVFAPEPDYVISEDERDILSYVRSGPRGIPGSALNQVQLDDLAALVGSFARRLPDDVAGAQLRELERAGLDSLNFAWAGGTEPGSGTTSGSRALRCSSSTTTPRATVTTFIRHGATRRTISATTFFLSTTASTAARAHQRGVTAPAG